MAREFHQEIFNEISVIKGAFNSEGTRSSSGVRAFIGRVVQVVGNKDMDLGRSTVRVEVITGAFLKRAWPSDGVRFLSWASMLRLTEA
jgi:hypothetical protein